MEGVGARARATARRGDRDRPLGRSMRKRASRGETRVGWRRTRRRGARGRAERARRARKRRALETVYAPEQVPVLDVGGEGVSPLVGAPSAARGERVDVLRGAHLIGGGWDEAWSRCDVVKGQRSWRERARAREVKISVGSNSSRRVRGKTRKHGREGRRERTGGRSSTYLAPRQGSSHVRSTAGVCRASPSPAGRPGGEGGQVPGPRVGEIGTHPRALRRVQRKSGEARGRTLARSGARHASRPGGPVVDVDLDRLQRLALLLRRLLLRRSLELRLEAHRLGRLSEASASCATGPARVRPTFATGFLRDVPRVPRDDRGRGRRRARSRARNLPGQLRRGRGVAVGDVLQSFFAFDASRAPGAWWPPWRFPFRSFPAFASAKDARAARGLAARVAMNASPDSLALPPVACSRAARSAARERSANSNINPTRKRVQKREKNETRRPPSIDGAKVSDWCAYEMYFFFVRFFPLKAKGSSEKNNGRRRSKGRLGVRGRFFTTCC